jgi:mono/diheme cytochrome c family protein
MREFGLILKTWMALMTGQQFTMRGVPTSGPEHRCQQRPRTDGRATGPRRWVPVLYHRRVIHATKTLNRIPAWTPPLTAEELDAWSLQLAGPAERLSLPLQLKGTVARRGQDLFLSLGKCFRCHGNAGGIQPDRRPAAVEPARG